MPETASGRPGQEDAAPGSRRRLLCSRGARATSQVWRAATASCPARPSGGGPGGVVEQAAASASIIAGERRRPPQRPPRPGPRARRRRPRWPRRGDPRPELQGSSGGYPLRTAAELPPLAPRQGTGGRLKRYRKHSTGARTQGPHTRGGAGSRPTSSRRAPGVRRCTSGHTSAANHRAASTLGAHPIVATKAAVGDGAGGSGPPGSGSLPLGQTSTFGPTPAGRRWRSRVRSPPRRCRTTARGPRSMCAAGRRPRAWASRIPWAAPLADPGVAAHQRRLHVVEVEHLACGAPRCCAAPPAPSGGTPPAGGRPDLSCGRRSRTSSTSSAL